MIISFVAVCPSHVIADNLGISAKSAVLIEAVTGKVLYGKNEKSILPVASTTKIMTTLLCLESGDLDEQFVVNSDAIKVEGSSMGLQEGDLVTKRILCYGMMLPSGNDAANAIAIELGGSFENFSIMMNNKAKEIGMEDTNFVTPSGLHDDKHLSTAYDMALLTREAMKNKDFCDICSEKSVKLQYGNPPYDRWLSNSNKLLKFYDGCTGVKTGFTDEAGRCLVSSAEKDGVRLIAVTLNAPDDWNDHKKMLDYGFSQLKCYKLDSMEVPEDVKVVGSQLDEISIGLSETPMIPFCDGEQTNVTCVVLIEPFVYAPVNAGDTVGVVRYYYEGKDICDVNITALQDAPYKIVEQKESFISKLINSIFSKDT